MKRVLVATYGGAHVAAAIPLHGALIAAGLQPVMLGLTTAADTLRRHGIESRRFLDYVDLDDPHIRRWGEYLCGFHHRDGIGISREESMAYLGAGMADLVHEQGEAAALDQYRQLGLNALLPVARLRHILQAERIDGVITTDSPRAERAALNAAAQLRLPSVCAVTSFPHIGLHYLRRADNGAMMCVLNERIKDQLVAAGRAPGTVAVTGNPAFDALATAGAKTLRQSLRAGNGITASERVVLWAEQPEPGNPALPALMRERLAQICRARGWRLMVRLHPSSQADVTVDLPPDVLVSPRTESVRDALLQSDAVVTFTSTIGFEALVLDQPVVVAAVSQYSSFVDYRDTDGVWVVDSIDAVEQALLGFFEDDPTARRLAAYRRSMPRTGRAAAAIVDCLMGQTALPPIQSVSAS